MITVDLGRLGIRPADRVLDIGCGSGRHTGALYYRWRVFAIGADHSFAEISAAKSRLFKLREQGLHGGGRWGLCQADTLRLPFKRGAFDVVICSEVLEHVHRHGRAVREINRVLKSEGSLAVSVPRFWPEKICWLLSKDYALADGGHQRIYRQAGLTSLFEAVGLEQRGRHFAHSLHTPYWWLKCIVGPQREAHPLVALYRQFLTWDIMKQPRVTALVERLLNPVMGKSLVVYFKKP